MDDNIDVNIQSYLMILCGVSFIKLDKTLIDMNKKKYIVINSGEILSDDDIGTFCRVSLSHKGSELANDIRSFREL